MKIETDNQGNKYFKNDKGQLHRTDGPAVEYADGYKQWWICRIKLPEKEFDYWSKDWNEEKEIMFKLSYS